MWQNELSQVVFVSKFYDKLKVSFKLNHAIHKVEVEIVNGLLSWDIAAMLVVKTYSDYGDFLQNIPCSE